jgi:ATP-binding cassette subfamily B multidrug efflux pump
MNNKFSQIDSALALRKQPFIYYMKTHPRAFLMGSACLLITNSLDVMTPLALRSGIDAVATHKSDQLVHAIFLYAALMSGVMCFRFGWRVFFGKFHHSVAEDLRNRIFAKLTSLGPSFYQRSSVGELMSLITNDVNQFRMAIGPGVLTMLDGVFLLALILPLMISMSWDWTWKTLIFIPLVPFFMRKMETLIHLRFREQQDLLSKVSARAQEIVSGIRVTKSFAQEDTQLASFNVESKKYEIASNRVAIVDAAFNPVMSSAVALGSAILLWWGSPDVVRGAITIGTFVAFQQYIGRMIWPMSAIGFSASMLEQGRASLDRILELLETETDIPDQGTKTLESFMVLDVQDLSFRYAGANANALTDVNFSIQKGETVGIVGPVGAGKTTLLQLISRLYPAPKDSIKYNGIDVADLKRSSLTELVSFVTQDAFLFSDTISENVAYGLNIFPGMEPVENVTALVSIDSEIRAIPGNYSAYLGERGVNLSGGQKQRLTIARALIRHSLLILLDDSLSAVDGKTEKAITHELRNARGAKTVVIVSHRLATLKHADRIIVMNRGRIEAIDSHDGLLKSSPTYQRLHELQSAPSQTADIQTEAVIS